MAIEGPLKELGIHDVFQLLDVSRKTGVLRITSKIRHNQGTVYFDGGAVVHAEIQSNPHRLGGLLVGAGKRERTPRGVGEGGGGGGEAGGADPNRAPRAPAAGGPPATGPDPGRD